MYSKYENKTYTQGIQNEASDLENESKNITIKNNIVNNTDTEKDKFLKTTFQPKCIFTKQNNNISFYQSTSKNSFRSLQNNKNLCPTSDDKNTITLKKPPSAPLQILGEEKFSYNYTALDKNSTNKSKDKNINSKSERVNLNPQLMQKYKKPKRTIKSSKKQFNMEKSDNFNVLSYRPEKYESDTNLIMKDKGKKIQIYKKQEVNEIFYPSKRTHSPQLDKELIEKYQTHTLKYQSFFGSFNCSKNSHMAKSTSKIKTNQLNDFNIDKLIEIGDRYANQCKPVLPLGKIMNNNIIFRTKNKKNTIPYNSKSNFNDYSISNEIKGYYNSSSYNLKNRKRDLEKLKENSVNLVREKKRVTKKIISKNNLKNTTTYDENKEIYSKDSTVKKNLNFNTELIDKTDKKLISNIKMKKKQIKKINKNSSSHSNNFDKSEEMLNYQEIEPIKTNPKRKKYMNLSINQKENIENNHVESFNIVNNRNEKLKIDTTEKKLLTTDEAYYKNNNNYHIPIEKVNNIQNKEILINNNKKYKNNKIASNIYYKDNKQKNYYGYDERHNLEDTINNHAYFESVHSKKKLSNRSFDKIN